MTGVVTALLTLLQTIAPAVAGSGAIGSVIKTITELMPVLVDEFQDVLPSVKNIIEALRENGDITDEQWDELDKVEAAIDKAFDDAAAAAEEEDKD